jgi:hypothetical protein
LALEWVQLNIAQFGGDPEQVTIMVRVYSLLSVGVGVKLIAEYNLGPVCRFGICGTGYCPGSHHDTVQSWDYAVWGTVLYVADSLIHCIRRFRYGSRMFRNPWSCKTQLLKTRPRRNHPKLY